MVSSKHMLKYASDIIKCVENADRKLGRSSNLPDKPIPLVLMGGAAVMLGHKGKRWTMDIDAIYTEGLKGLGSVMEELHVVTDSIAYLHPDYMDRVAPLKQFRNISLFLLSPIDIIISKSARGYQKDFKDIYDSTLTDQIDPDEFDSLYTEAMDYWIGGRKDAFIRNKEEAIAIIREKRLLNETGITGIIQEQVDAICASGGLQTSIEADAVRYILGSLEEKGALRKLPGVRESAEYLLSYGGESLVDTRAEMVLINLVRRHFERTTPFQINASAGEGVNPARLFKFFKTLAWLVNVQLNENTMKEAEKLYNSP